MIGTGSMCDPYMPVEQDLQLTRRCLEIIEKYRFGATVLTKSDLVLRDLDILTRINAATKAVLQITLTTFDEALCRIVEPAVCTTRRRFEVMCAFQDAGVPVVVWLSPILPFINDSLENLEGILDYCIRAGVRGIIAFGFGLTLREGNREYFYAQLDRHFPGLRRRYEQTYGFSYSLPSPNENSLKRRFNELCSTHGILHTPRDVFNYLNLFENSSREHTVPEPVQGELF
jgi:DNA repair photolyase